MLWDSTFCKESSDKNLLASGTCACPGIVTGQICVWDKNSQSSFEEGDILILDHYVDDFPLWAIEKSNAVISCRHTSYSHLTSFAMALNKPCIVGAVFHRMPDNHSRVTVDAWERLVVNADDMAVLMSPNQKDWLADTADKVCSKLYSETYKPLAHVVSFDGSECYMDHISGIFLDSFLFQKEAPLVKRMITRILEIHHTHPDIEIYYRFSQDSICPTGHTSQLQRELEFVRFLQDNGIPVSVFVANTTSYADILAFRKFISDALYPNPPARIGTMIENTDIVGDLDSIVSDKLINFGAIGINDLLSSCLQLERDDPRNQEEFRIDSAPALHVLSAINKSLSTQKIPCFIGFPKYPHFHSDYEVLIDLGYHHFFGTQSLFAIAAKYSFEKE